MTIIGDAFIAVKPDTKGFGPETEKSVIGGVTSIAKKAAVAFGGVFAAQKVGGLLTGAIGDAREANRINRQTEAVIKSTGAAANATFDDIEKLSGSIQSYSGISDEAVQEGANLLLTFTNIRNEAGKGNDIFNQTTRIMTDVATAMGQEPRQAAIQLGKALNDPVKGVSALGEVGITFTEQQKELISTLVESGDTMGAQKVILKELETQFGGSAKAQADAGKLLGATLADLQEEIGQRLLPIFDAAARFAADKLPVALDALGRGFGFVADLAAPLIDTLREIAGVGKQLFDVLFRGDFTGGPLAEDSPIVDVAFRLRDAIAELAPKVEAGFRLIFDGYKRYLGFVFGEALPAVVDFLTGTVVPGVVSAIDSLVKGIQGEGGEGSFFTDLGETIAALAEFIVEDAVPAFEEHLLPIIEDVIGFVKRNAKPILIALGVTIAALAAPVATAVAAFVFLYQRFEIVRDIVAGVVGAFQGFVRFLTTTVAPFVERVAATIGEQFGNLSRAIGERMDAITEAIGHIVTVLERVAQVILVVFIGPIVLAWQQFGDEIVAIIGIAWDQVQNIVETAVALLTALIDTALALINGDFGEAWDAISQIPRIAFEYIVETVRNLLRVLGEVLGGAWETIKTVASGAWQFVRDKSVEFVGGMVTSIREKIDGIVSFFGEVPERLARVGRGLFDWIKEAFESAINAVLRGWNRLEFKIPGFKVGPVGYDGFTLGVPDIPLVDLADGGLIRARPGVGTLARIGEATRPTNEAVLPLPDAVVNGLAAIAEGGGTGPLVGQLVVPNATMDTAVALANRAVDRLQAERWRLGR